MGMNLDTVVPGSKLKTVKPTDAWHGIMPLSVHKYVYTSRYNHHLYFPAQLVVFTLIYI